MDHFIKQLRNMRHTIRFDAEKKAAVRADLISYMRGSDALRESEALRRSMQSPKAITAWKGNMKFFKFALPVALVVFVGAGTSFAAEQALPGNPLYAIKVGINEKVASALTFSATGKTEFDAHIAATRLAEASELAAQGKLDTETATKIQQAFEASAGRAESRLAALRASGDVDAAESISANFAAALRAHERALGVIAGDYDHGGDAIAMSIGGSASASAKGEEDRNASANAKKGTSLSLRGDMIENQSNGNGKDDDADASAEAISKIAGPLKAALKTVSDDHRNAQAELTGGAEVAAKVAAEKKIAASVQIIAAVRITLAQLGAKIPEDASAKAAAELKLAADLEAQAEIQAKAGNYRDAVVLANHAIQAANEVKVLLSLQVAIDGHEGSAPAGAPMSARNTQMEFNLFSNGSDDNGGSGSAGTTSDDRHGTDDNQDGSESHGTGNLDF